MGLPPALPSPLLIYSHLLRLPPCSSEALAEEGGKVATGVHFFATATMSLPMLAWL